MTHLLRFNYMYLAEQPQENQENGAREEINPADYEFDESVIEEIKIAKI